MLATEYAEYFKIEAQREGESDLDFRRRVAGILREKDELIYANEALCDKYLDYAGGDALACVKEDVAIKLLSALLFSGR